MTDDACVVIPWRTDHGWREQLFRWVLAAWEATGLPISIGTPDDGPFNASQALNRARASTDAHWLIVASADHVPDLAAVHAAIAHDAPWAPIFGATAGIGRATTELLIAGRLTADRVASQTTSHAPFCTALLAVRSDVWDDAGGWDESFVGWGCEDTAFRMVLDTLHPDPPEADACTIALWHEAAPRDHFEANAARLGPYIAAAGDPDAMRTLVRTR